jgi:hypothetical protein
MSVNWTEGEPAVEQLTDEELLALCESRMEAGQQKELSDLLARNREGLLRGEERNRLGELLQIYRRGLVDKARALKTAVDRGLKPPLS